MTRAQFQQRLARFLTPHSLFLSARYSEQLAIAFWTECCNTVQECTDEQSRSSRTSTSVSIALIDTFPATSTQCENSIHGGAEFLNGPALASAAALRQIIDNF